MIERILPGAVRAVESWQDAEEEVGLFPEEELALGRAVEKRRREFTTGRACARAALRELGLAPRAIPAGEHGEPRWPEQVVGSITHCERYRACAVARSREMLTVGIDAEPNAPLPDGLLADVARPEERTWLGGLRAQHPDVHWDRLLFSAKESVYKAWFPLAERWLGFEDATLTVNPQAGTFVARLLIAGPMLAGRRLTRLDGRWIVGEGIIVTAIAMEARSSTGAGVWT